MGVRFGTLGCPEWGVTFEAASGSEEAQSGTLAGQPIPTWNLNDVARNPIEYSRLLAVRRRHSLALSQSNVRKYYTPLGSNQQPSVP
jgi:hypothetical protein